MVEKRPPLLSGTLERSQRLVHGEGRGAGLGPRPEGGRAGAGWKLKLKEQQKIHEVKHDMQRYLSRGRGQRRPGLCSGSLDQLLVTDTSDLEAFDDFLSSSANDARSSTSSLTSG
ncbi:unnamed protein product [Gadus morhua 'NCC']